MKFIQKYLKRDSQGRPIFEREESVEVQGDETSKETSLTLQRCSNCRTHLEHEDVQIQCAFCDRENNRAMCKQCLCACSSCGKPCCSVHRTSFAPTKVTVCPQCRPQMKRYEQLLLEFDIVKERGSTKLPGTLGVIQGLIRERALRNLQRKLKEL